MYWVGFETTRLMRAGVNTIGLVVTPKGGLGSYFYFGILLTSRPYVYVRSTY